MSFGGFYFISFFFFFFFFGGGGGVGVGEGGESLGLLWYIFEKGVLFMYTLEGVSSVANFNTA